MQRPIKTFSYISSRHGEPASGFYGKHLGTDYATPLNTVVVAPVSGKILRTGWSNEVGYFIEISGSDARTHRLLHLNRIDVSIGQNVSEGAQIGLSGSTGSSSTGPHLHWDARKAGTSFESGFNNYFDTEALLVSNPSTPTPQTDTVHLPASVATWAVYKPGSGLRKGTSDQVGTLLPSKFGGLTYKIVARVGDYAVTVDTEQLGRVTLWTKDTEAVFNTATKPQANTVTLPAHVATWAAYSVGSAYRKGTSDQVGTLLPSAFGGLTYPIVQNLGNVVVIDTQSFGRVAIWVKDTDAVIR